VRISGVVMLTAPLITAALAGRQRGYSSGTDEPLAPVENRGLTAVLPGHLGGVGPDLTAGIPCTRRSAGRPPQRHPRGYGRGGLYMWFVYSSNPARWEVSENAEMV